jgi:hypothetical protein
VPEPVRVTLLYNATCPSHEAGRALLEAASQAAGVALAVEEREIIADAEAEALRFPGSPTFHVGERDLVAGAEGPFRWDACRAYSRPDGTIAPLPTLEQLADALRAAAKETA